MKKPFLAAAYSGILFLIIGILFGIVIAVISLFDLPILTSTLSIIYFIISCFFGVIFSYGFVLIGKKFSSKLFVVLSYIGIVILILMTLLVIFGNTVSIVNVTKDLQNGTSLLIPDFDKSPNAGFDSEDTLTGLVILLILWVFISIFLGLYTILFGVELLKIGKKLEFSQSAGILNIIAGASLIIFIGYLLIIPVAIIEILMFFKASEKFEKRKSTGKQLK